MSEFSKAIDVQLFDPENGETTKAFIAAFKKNVPKGYKLNFLDADDSTAKSPLVVVVRSTTMRFEEDFDAALECTREKFLKSPDVIIYFHMKKYTATALNTIELKEEYNGISVIDMDFTKYKLFTDKYFTSNRSLKDKNTFAYGKLQRHICRFTQSDFKNKLFVCDKVETDTSRTIIKELQLFMGKKLIVKTGVLEGGSPILVLCDHTWSANNDEFKGLEGTNSVLFYLRTEKGQSFSKEDAVHKKFAFIEDIDISGKERYFITFEICERLITFVRQYSHACVKSQGSQMSFFDALTNVGEELRT